MRKDRPVRETINYPKVTVTSTYDPCHDRSFLYEHVLTCGHLITTLEPDEPCAPNCHRATGIGSRQAPKMTLSKALEKDFYCDACVEVDGEGEIPATATNGEAGKQNEPNAETDINRDSIEDQRAEYREMTAARRNKARDFRKCYMAQKVVSVPCDEHGNPVFAYNSTFDFHPYDLSWPPTGANMYEDIEVIKVKKSRKKKKKRPLFAVLNEPDDAAIDINAAVAENIDDTLAEGARWLREEEERERR
ncbi:hypothetical protein E8E12_004301 [Didymella heteroderae]|uniref:Uncharacterized protein n=1 Tax=Didymella heteroderae TaxID=1769908 RepID=A0A9P5BXS7_9PLEO|nr:hypothetical protein E8E12_004301 [Didymella heteroderae]